MILSCSNISKAFGTEEILKHVSLHVEDHEKAAIVGINGAGKSTLLKIIVGELAADEGSVTITKGKTLGYLAQHQDLHSQTTIYDSLLEVKRPILEMEQQIRTLELQMKHAEGEKLETMLNTYSRLNHEFELLNGYAWQSEITGVLKGLGFVEEEFSKPVSELSGGQKTRVSLGKLLLSKPDIILLDEPTNHLDMESIAWLETYLMNYAGTVIIVAHDRYFLDRVVTKIVELDGGIATSFQGNYTAYSEKRAMLREAKQKIASLIGWLKDVKAELSAPQPPTLVELLSAYYDDRNRGAYSGKAKIGNLKKFSETVSYLESKQLRTTEDLDALLNSMQEQIDTLKESASGKQARIKELDELLRMTDYYQQGKPVADKLKTIRFEKSRQKYKEEHENVLWTFYMAERKLKDQWLDGKISVHAWRREKAKLETEYQMLQQKIKPLHADTKKLWAIHYSIYQVQHEQERQNAVTRQKKQEIEH